MSTTRKLKRLREALKAVDVDDKRGVLTAYGERFLLIPLKLIRSIEDRLTDSHIDGFFRLPRRFTRNLSTVFLCTIRP